MAFGQIGPVTNAAEAAATAVGAGILLGSFVFGAVAFLGGASREELERRVLRDGYLGGLLAVGVGLVDLVLRYGA